MMKASSKWRWLAVMSAAAFALAIAASAFAQAPPAPPHQFYGSGATLDGETSDGTVTATNQDGEAVGSSSIDMGAWAINVDAADADSVTFSIDGSDPSDSYDVEGAGVTEVSLALTSPMADEDDMGDTEDDMPGDDAEDMPGDDMGDDMPGDDAEDMPADDMGDMPDGLPDTGSGGLAGGSSLPALPLALAISIAVALGGVLAVRRIRA